MSTPGRSLDRPIRVLVCDDHFVVRDGVRSRLERQPGFEVVGEAEEGAEAVELARRLEPDVVLMDLSMPGMDGAEATGRIKAELPNARVLVLTTYDDDDRILAAFAKGAAGYLLKDRSRQELHGAVREVVEGGVPVDPRVNARLIRYLGGSENEGASSQMSPRPAGSLTRRELEMLALAAEGLENKEIARRLYVTHSNVKWHFNNIYKKLGVHHRAAAVLAAIDSGILNRDT
jgi:DNA-binding NarL/FixJ family response regulator